MKRTIPLLITAIGGFVLIIAFFIPAFQRAGEEAAIWFDILAAIAFILGGANLFRLQLQKISDQQPGWGYAVVTLLFFVATLVFGLLKVNCPPETSVEAYGETFASLPLSALPQFSLPAQVPPTRADDEPLPKSVRRQLSILKTSDGLEIQFSGWMTKQQFEDLSSYQDTLAWKCQIEQLSKLTQLPASLKGKVRYDASHHVLAFRGAMTEDDRQALLKALPASPATAQSIDHLFQESQRVTSIAIGDVPSTFEIPEDQQSTIQLVDGRLQIRGPMSVETRDQLASKWRHDPRTRTLTEEQKSELLDQIQQRGHPLNSSQRAAFDNFFAADWPASLLEQDLNTAGISDPEPKTACELLNEIQSGVSNPELTRPAPPPVVLNAAQVAAIQEFIETPETKPSELLTQLASAGTLTDAQKAAFARFFNQLPTQADQRRTLCFRLLETGSLTKKQRDFLLAGAREHFHWRQQIGKLFLKAHHIKFPWSGFYSAQGSPFWWLYEYVFQPLLTTTFALLAFYVASAAFRAFRAKNLEAVLLLGTAFIILLGRTSAGPALTNWIPDQFSAFHSDQLTVYIMSIFNTAGNRAIMIGIALGTVSTSLKVLLGIDRSYLGKGND